MSKDNVLTLTNINRRILINVDNFNAERNHFHFFHLGMNYITYT